MAKTDLKMTQGEPAYRPLLRKHIDEIDQLQALSEHERNALKAVSAVLPFRVNRYVLENLIDWGNIPDDPIYRLTFPHRDMLASRATSTA